MRIKLILLTILIGVAVFLFHYYSTKNSNEITQTIEVEMPTETAIDPINPVEQSVTTDKEPVKSDKIEDIKPALINDVTYSADPVVNAYTIYRNTQLCHSQLDKDNSTSYLHASNF